MGNRVRAKGFRIEKSDLKNMSPREAAAVTNGAFLKHCKIEGAASVRAKDGSVRYDEPGRAGSYGEQKL